MIKRTLMIASLFTVASGGVALADHHGGSGGDGDRKDGMMKERMMEMDSNKDGAISRDEFMAGHGVKFSEADANGDGKVSKDEFTAHWDRMAAERRKAMQDRRFSRMDADGNGVISEAEFAAHGGKMFEMMDADKDGNLTKDDRRKGDHGKKYKKDKGE